MKSLSKLIVILLLPCFMSANLPLVALAAPVEEDPTLQITHSKLKSAATGEIIPVTAEFEDPEGVELVRIYFRAAGSEPYYFVPMIVSKNSEYYGILPAPSGSAETIEYLFLVKTYNNRIFNSQSYSVAVSQKEKTASDAEPETIDVSTETKEIPRKIEGFDEKTRIRQVTNYEKHGIVAGLYDFEETGGTASTGQYHGTITASKKSHLNTILIGGGVAAAAVAVGVLATSSSSGSSGSSPSDPGGGVTSTGAGRWTLNFDFAPCSRTTSQVVECSEEGLVTAVSPTAIGVPLPEDCSTSPYAGVSDVFIVGGSCDTVTACNAHATADLTSKTCGDNSMVFIKQDGAREERWSVQ